MHCLGGFAGGGPDMQEDGLLLDKQGRERDDREEAAPRMTEESRELRR
jgi:hypothetical protein